MVKDLPQIAIISDEPTPYRLHVLGRIARELPQVVLHSIFTHPKTSMPWNVKINEEIRPITFPECSLNDKWIISLSSIPLFRRIVAYLLEKHVRLVILLGYNDLTRLLLLRWARAKGIPLLLTGDSNVFNEGRHHFLLRVIKRMYVGHVVEQVAGLMPMGTCGRAYYRLYADHNKPTFLFPYEPDYNRLKNCDAATKDAFLRRYGLDPLRHRLLYSGRLVGAKRIDLLLEAFARIAEFRQDWDLVIAGDGPLREELQSRVPAALRGRIKWLGFIQFEDLIPCYHCSDALVLPSENEPWALVINEAVATGLPVVVTDVVGAAVELVRHGINGYMVPPRNVESLIEALKKITDPARNGEMRAAAPAILTQWRTAADPVKGVRLALKYFHVIP